MPFPFSHLNHQIVEIHQCFDILASFDVYPIVVYFGMIAIDCNGVVNFQRAFLETCFVRLRCWALNVHSLKHSRWHLNVEVRKSNVWETPRNLHKIFPIIQFMRMSYWNIWIQLLRIVSLMAQRIEINEIKSFMDNFLSKICHSHELALQIYCGTEKLQNLWILWDFSYSMNRN